MLEKETLHQFVKGTLDSADDEEVLDVVKKLEEQKYSLDDLEVCFCFFLFVFLVSKKKKKNCVKKK